jgi:hypothetical protein
MFKSVLDCAVLIGNARSPSRAPTVFNRPLLAKKETSQRIRRRGNKPDCNLITANAHSALAPGMTVPEALGTPVAGWHRVIHRRIEIA